MVYYEKKGPMSVIDKHKRELAVEKVCNDVSVGDFKKTQQNMREAVGADIEDDAQVGGEKKPRRGRSTGHQAIGAGASMDHTPKWPAGLPTLSS